MEIQELEKLLSELQSNNVQQRRAASYKLGKYKNPMVVSALIQAYKDNDTDVSIQNNVIIGLRNIGSKEAVDFLDSKGIPSKLKLFRINYIYIIIFIILVVTAPHWLVFVFGVCIGWC